MPNVPAAPPDDGPSPRQVGGTPDRPRTPRPEDLVRSAAGPNAAWWRPAAIGAAALVLALAALVGVWLFARTLALLFVAIAIAEALAPVVAWLERRLPRVLAVVLVYLVLALALGALGWVFVPRLVDQAQQLALNVPDLIARGQELVDRWDPGGQARILRMIESSVGRFSAALVAAPFTLVSSLTQILLVLFMSLYWLLSAPALGRFVRSLVPARRGERIGALTDEIAGSVGGYLRGETINAVIVGGAVYTGLLVIGVDFPLVLAFVAAVGELVPVVGPIAAAVPAVIVAFVASPSQGLVTAAFYLVLQQVESNILVPQIMKRQADVPPLLALVALFAGVEVGGILGALVAIPLAGAVKVIVVRVVAPAVRRWTGVLAPAPPKVDG